MKKLIVIGVALLIAGAVSVRAADAKENWRRIARSATGRMQGKTKMGESSG